MACLPLRATRDSEHSKCAQAPYLGTAPATTRACALALACAQTRRRRSAEPRRATSAFLESDRPDAPRAGHPYCDGGHVGGCRRRTIAMPPRKGAPAPTDGDDRFDDSRHPRRTLAFNGKHAPVILAGVGGSRRAWRTRAFYECARHHVGALWTLAASRSPKSARASRRLQGWLACARNRGAA
jgi:hypothetical protein